MPAAESRRNQNQPAPVTAIEPSQPSIQRNATRLVRPS